MGFVIAQIIGVLASILVMISMQMKEKKKYLIIYGTAHLLFLINMILLKAYAGAVNCALLAILTVISAKMDDKEMPKWLLVVFAITVTVGSVLTYTNIFSILPVIASYMYLIVLATKNMTKVRKATVAIRIAWGTYDFIVKAYTTFVFDIFSFISSIIAIYRYDIKKSK